MHSSTLPAPNEAAQGSLQRQKLDFVSGVDSDRSGCAAFELSKRLAANVEEVKANLKASMERNERASRRKMQVLEVSVLAWVLDTTTSGVQKLAHAWDGPWRIVEKPNPDILVLEDVKDKKKRSRRHREAVQPLKAERGAGRRVSQTPGFKGTRSGRFVG